MTSLLPDAEDGLAGGVEHAGRKIITVFDQEFQKFVERVDVTSFIDMLDIEELQHTVQLNRIQVSTI